MPNVGANLSDKEVADVLTYIRNAWSNTGGPVAPEKVASVREEISGRGTTPWTAPELEEVKFKTDE
jgi:mono/diheme cytochrome c family protein